MLLDEATRSILPRSLLSAAAIYAIGCVIPAPLESREAQHHPQIVAGLPADFGYIDKPASSEWAVGVAAVDQDVDDVLTARLMVRDGSRYIRLTEDIRLQASNKDDLTLRRGSFLSLQYCAFRPFESMPPPLLYVCVTDGTFKRPDSSPDEPDFATSFDCKYWIVRCVLGS